MGRQLGRLLLNLGLVIVSLAFCLAASESVFYFLNRSSLGASADIESVESTPLGERRDFFQYDYFTGFSGLPNLEKTFFDKKVTHNSRGFRMREMDYRKAEGVARIVFIGDSQTWGLGLDDGETIPAFAENVLNNDGQSRRFEAVNLGASGYGIDQSYLRLLIDGFSYQPDYVVFTYFADNDVWETASNYTWGVEKPYVYFKDGKPCLSNFPPKRASGWPSDKIGVVARSLLNIESPVVSFLGFEVNLAQLETVKYFSSRGISTSLLEAWQRGWTEFGHEFFTSQKDPNRILKTRFECIEKEPGPFLETMAEKLDLAMMVMRLMKDSVEGNNAKLIVVTKPIEEDYRNEQPGADYRAVLARLSEMGVPTVDLYAAGKAEGVSADDMFIAAGHLSPRGAELVAQRLDDLI